MEKNTIPIPRKLLLRVRGGVKQREINALRNRKENSLVTSNARQGSPGGVYVHVQV